MNAVSNRAAQLNLILNGPVLPVMLRLGLPVIAVIMAQTVVGVLETFWLSRLGTETLAGVSLVLPLFVLMATMSNGGIGGGVSSAVARAAGAGDQAGCDALLRHAIVIAICFGLAFTVLLVALAPVIYGALGGTNDALSAAVIYSNWTFGGAILIWIVNLLSSAMRGAGEVRLPAIVTVSGAIILAPLSPLLIFGWGPVPALGIAGAGLAVLIYYAGAALIFLRYLMSGKGVLTLRAGPLSADRFRSILVVGLISAIGTLMASLTVVIAVGAAGRFGTEVLAGFGVASRLDSLLIPLLFGLGTAVVTMTGTATGAGRPERAREVAWKAGVAGLIGTGVIGLGAAFFPGAWTGIFTDDPAVQAAGATYLSTVGLFYGAFGLGLMLYFANQGRGKMGWPFVAGLARLALTAGGAFAIAASGGSFFQICIAVSVGYAVFGLINAYGIWRG